jgi:antitoxin component YwqK of YwqJK toxin-antitoxin module
MILKLNYLKYFILVYIFVMPGMKSLLAQDFVKTDGYQKFYYPGGVLSSEGLLKNGKPDGYWKSYHENGKIKSEGNRRNWELDSIWKFYNEEGKLILEVNYKAGRKNGKKTSYADKETIVENFKNDVKDGYTRYYFADGRLKLEIPFVNGVEQGFGKEFGADGTIVTLTEYKRGFIVDRLRINRKDQSGLKQGRWYYFYASGSLKMEGTYRNDKKEGYFKEYTEQGDLLRISKYVNDVIQPDAAEIQKLEVENEYYPDGKVRVSSMYRNGIPEGVKREFNPEGKVERAYLFRDGILIGEGIIREDGNKDGPWKDYYPDGKVKAEGNYDNGKQVGEWKYYHQNGRIEQAGRFSKQGKLEGTWKWYYETGTLAREEHYRNGLKDGLLTENDESGKTIEEGEYVDGLEDGSWFEQLGDSYMRGHYQDGKRTGVWVHYYLFREGERTDSVVSFRGNFIEDNPDGKHVYYWESGQVKDEGMYVMGKKEGEWYKYNSDGTLFLIITYKNGTEVRYDGVKIKPPFEMEE